jgi:SAM-dependent methyltransferase
MVAEKPPLRPTGAEALDARGLDDAVAQIVLNEIALTNILFGGHAAVKFGLRKLLRGESAASRLRILDIGAGSGHATRRVCRLLGDRLTHPIALDHHRASARMCRERGITAVVGDLHQLPVRPISIDIAIVSMVLHHLPRPEAVSLIEQLDAVARLGVVVTDLRRSLLAVAGFDLAGRMLRLHEVTRRDGLLSIRRGFTAKELAGTIADAGVGQASVYRRPGWRLVAYWRTHHANG